MRPQKEECVPVRRAITNQKGGVSKTTTSGHVSHGLALQGRRVLMVDTDPSSNLTRWLAATTGAGGPTLAEALVDSAVLAAAIGPTRAGTVEILRGSSGLAAVEYRLRSDPASYPSPATLLRDLLRDPLLDVYDDIVIDTPPNLGLLAISAIIAADEILVPELPEPMALFGLIDLLSTIDNAVKRGLRPAVSARILPSLVDRRVDLTGVVLDRLGSFDARVTTTQIPRNVRLAATVGHGKTVFDTAPKSTGARAYRSLALELLG